MTILLRALELNINMYYKRGIEALYSVYRDINQTSGLK